MPAPVVIDLDCSESPLRLLRAFHAGVYTREFPDPDERELLANMEDYLRRKSEGWHGRNNYHILLLLQEESGEIAGGVVADYFACSNVGVIEFMVVDPAQQGRGLGRRLLSEITHRFRVDAVRAGYAALCGICGEVNDPYRRCEVQEHLDAFARLRMWHGFGFGLLDFPYVQPALSEGQEAVHGLGLMFRPETEECRSSVPARFVRQFVADYQVWAMRIPEPEARPEFRRIAEWLRPHRDVRLLDMLDYIGEEPEPLFHPVEIRDGDHTRLAQFARVYQECFSNDETAVEVSEFSRGTCTITDGPLPHHYWLWGIIAAGEAELSGLASFFSFPHCGFGGYVAIAAPLRGKGCFRRLLRLMERQIVQVNEVASGWYVECEPDSVEAAIFKHCSFTEVPMTYRQPRLHTDMTGVSEGKHLELLYKPFGRVYGPPELSLEDLQRDLREILTRIYYLDASGVNTAMAKMTWPRGTATDIFARTAPTVCQGGEPPEYSRSTRHT